MLNEFDNNLPMVAAKLCWLLHFQVMLDEFGINLLAMVQKICALSEAYFAHFCK